MGSAVLCEAASVSAMLRLQGSLVMPASRGAPCISGKPGGQCHEARAAGGGGVAAGGHVDAESVVKPLLEMVSPDAASCSVTAATRLQRWQLIVLVQQCSTGAREQLRSHERVVITILTN